MEIIKIREEINKMRLKKKKIEKNNKTKSWIFLKR